jgi:hypothetical protein
MILTPMTHTHRHTHTHTHIKPLARLETAAQASNAWRRFPRTRDTGCYNRAWRSSLWNTLYSLIINSPLFSCELRFQILWLYDLYFIVKPTFTPIQSNVQNYSFLFKSKVPTAHSIGPSEWTVYSLPLKVFDNPWGFKIPMRLHVLWRQICISLRVVLTL